MGTLRAQDLEPRAYTHVPAGLSFGGGIKKFFNDRFGIRSQLRGFWTFLGSNEELYCDPFGCWTYSDPVNFTQFEISTGLIIRL